MAKCIIDDDTGLRLLPFDKPTKGILSPDSSQSLASSNENLQSIGSTTPKTLHVLKVAF